jgi:hypothetical protein
MTMFSPDGTYGFVCSSFTPELAVVEVQSHRVVERLTMVTIDGSQAPVLFETEN